jgi:hypothetical protein
MWQPSLLDETLTADTVTDLPLADFARQARVIEFRVPYVAETLFLVPHARHIPTLLESGIKRGRIWLADEVRDLLGADMSPRDVRKLVKTKLDFDGYLASARKVRR